ncbi:MAG: enoyl-CoA hydratase/isomerase family protein [Candidatus Binatia bacterium]
MARRYFQLEVEEELALVRFDRPPVNAIDIAVVQEFESLMSEIESDVRMGSVVITGRPGVFSAGLDLKAVIHYSPREQREMITGINRLLGKLYAFPLPVVAAVSGHAIAAGFVLALSCDYRVGAEGPFEFGLSEARVGIPFPAGALAIVQAEMDPAAKRAAVLVARKVGSAEALRYGVLDELVGTDRVLVRAKELAGELAGIPRQAYARIKRQLRAATVREIEATVASGSDPMLDSWIGPEAVTASAEVLAVKRS